MIKRLLIIRFSALGDVAMLVPVVKQLAEAYPQVDITMLSRQQMAPLFADMPANVHFAGADLKGRHHGTEGLRLLLKEIDYRRFDAVADMHNVLRSRYLTINMPMRVRVRHLHKGRWSKWWLTHGRHKQLPLMTERYARVLEKIGLPLRLKEMRPTQEGRAQRVGIAPFAAHRGKIYPPEKMEEVVRLLDAEGVEVLLFGGGAKEVEVLERWAERYEHVTSVAGRYPMNKEMELMGQLSVMLTMDSGNMHLGSLAGTRVLSIWGATHPMAGFMGYGQQESDCIQQELSCRPCSIYGNKPCRLGDYRCLAIEPETVVARIMEAIHQQ